MVGVIQPTRSFLRKLTSGKVVRNPWKTLETGLRRFFNFDGKMRHLLKKPQLIKLG
ncbi:hypothetical protein HAX54_049324, partial [Datura stramonium]|nr:hypothetical protein [Datura stramonium]